MSIKSEQDYFYHGYLPRLLIVFLFAIGLYFFHGFITPILAAIVIAVATWPIYSRLVAVLNYRQTLAATIAILIAIIFMVVPLGFMTVFALKEATLTLNWAVETNTNGAPAPEWIETLPFGGDWLVEKWDAYIGQPGMLGDLTQKMGGVNIGTLYKNVIATSGSIFKMILALIFMMITLFFLYRDAPKLIAQFDRVGEYFFPGRWTRYSRIIPVAINSTVLGMGLIAVAEGIILGLAYWLAGVPSPVILGIITGFMALIPGGAPLCFSLVSLYLIADGDSFSGTALFVWGCVELFIVDKFVRPRLVGGPMHLPFLPTFFGLIGGVKTMGFLGLFIGPALMAILVTIWREFVQDISDPNEPSDILNDLLQDPDYRNRAQVTSDNQG